MGIDSSFLHKILKDQTRRDILSCLNKGPLTYMELKNLVKVTNTGRFNYHLKALDDLIEKMEDGRYRLTDRGQLAVQLLEKFPEKSNEPWRSTVDDTANVETMSTTKVRKKKIGGLAGGAAGGFCALGAVMTIFGLFFLPSSLAYHEGNLSAIIGSVILGPTLFIIGLIIRKKALTKLAT
jgi:hypothetical protein